MYPGSAVRNPFFDILSGVEPYTANRINTIIRSMTAHECLKEPNVQVVAGIRVACFNCYNPHPGIF